MVTTTEKGVKLFVDNKEIVVSSPVEAFNDANGNFIVQFKTGKSKVQTFKLVFSEQHFIEIEEGE